jgi:5-methylcytosine-specific restriction endonuclease McrA
MPRKERHVVPNSEKGGWDSKRENAERASKHFDTKKKRWIGVARKQSRKNLN